MATYIDPSFFSYDKPKESKTRFLYCTSCGVNGITLRIEGEVLAIHSHLPVRMFSECLLFVKDSNGIALSFGQNYEKYSYDMKYRIPKLPDGNYYLSIYSKSTTDDKFYSFLDERHVPLSIIAGKAQFLTSPIESHNREVLMTMGTGSIMSSALSASDLIQKDNPNIKNLAKEITNGIDDEYEKIKNVHAWVARNIYYDKDSYVSQRHVNKDNSAVGTRVGQKGVCRGYTNLTAALLRSLGIPAVPLSVYTLGGIKDGGWNSPENKDASANHIIPVARIKNRWLIMDPTWDSPNNYEHKYYGGGHGVKYPYRYFDASIEFISQTHKFERAWNI